MQLKQEGQSVNIQFGVGPGITILHDNLISFEKTVQDD